ncbi:MULTISPECIES: S24 family peptidase [Staphylococcus]|uniref:S24 family peptidase n=1 Tax=Staphylococcus TaxID=1279 RepID=UPI00188DC8BA|nr:MULTISPECIES: S24 family peptidase [Staphylococcus]MDG4944607.1 helix-turn-helix domain-containing protein [Staphylococcus agnetis]
MKTTSDRLKQLMKDRNLRQVDILNMSKPHQKELGIKMSKSHLSQYVNAKSSPDQHKLYLLSKTLDVGEAWLMGYDVDSYRVPDEERQRENISVSLHQDIIENLDDLKESNAPLVNDFIEEIIKEQNNKSTFIPETARIQSNLSYVRQQNVLNYAHGQLEEQNAKNDNVIQMVTLSRIHASAAGVVGEELFDDIYEEEVEFEADKVPKGADYCVLVNGDSMEPMIRDGSCAFIKKTDTVADGTIALVIVDGAGYIKRVDIYDNVIRLVSLNPKYEDIIVQSHHDMKVCGKVVL